MPHRFFCYISVLDKRACFTPHFCVVRLSVAECGFESFRTQASPTRQACTSFSSQIQAVLHARHGGWVRTSNTGMLCVCETRVCVCVCVKPVCPILAAMWEKWLAMNFDDCLKEIRINLLAFIAKHCVGAYCFSPVGLPSSICECLTFHFGANARSHSFFYSCCRLFILVLQAVFCLLSFNFIPTVGGSGCIFCVLPRH